MLRPGGSMGGHEAPPLGPTNMAARRPPCPSWTAQHRHCHGNCMSPPAPLSGAEVGADVSPSLMALSITLSRGGRPWPTCWGNLIARGAACHRIRAGLSRAGAVQPAPCAINLSAATRGALWVRNLCSDECNVLLMNGCGVVY